MQLADFYLLVYEQFGEKLGSFYLKDTVLLTLDNNTAIDALEKGIEPKRVWHALCQEFNVAPENW